MQETQEWTDFLKSDLNFVLYVTVVQSSFSCAA